MESIHARHYFKNVDSDGKIFENYFKNNPQKFGFNDCFIVEEDLKQSVTLPWLWATPDFLITRPNGDRELVEIKATVSEKTFRTYSGRGSRNNAIQQLLCSMAIYGVKKATLISFKWKNKDN